MEQGNLAPTEDTPLTQSERAAYLYLFLLKKYVTVCEQRDVDPCFFRLLCVDKETEELIFVVDEQIFFVDKETEELLRDSKRFGKWKRAVGIVDPASRFCHGAGASAGVKKTLDRAANSADVGSDVGSVGELETGESWDGNWLISDRFPTPVSSRCQTPVSSQCQVPHLHEPMSQCLRHPMHSTCHHVNMPDALSCRICGVSCRMRSGIPNAQS